MINLIKILYRDPKYRVVAYFATAGISILTLFSVFLSYLFLNWYGEFYNSLQNLDFIQFKTCMYNFCTLAGISVVFDTCFKYINQRFAFMWRRCLTENLIRKWKKKRLNIEGSAQRIQEDCLKFTRIVESLYVGILKAVSNLVVFTPALWSLSNLVFPNVPGLLWFLALFYSIGGIIFSWWMGRRLPQLEFNNQVQEASFRTALEYKKGKYRTYIDNVQSNYYALYFEYFKFNLWGNSFFQASVIFPYAICGSALFAKLITLGTLVQISKAFDNIQGSLSYLIERWTDITELRSVTNRLNVFLTK